MLVLLNARSTADFQKILCFEYASDKEQYQ